MNNENTLIRLDEISIRSIVRDLLRNWWVMILAVLAALCFVSGYQNLVYTPVYTTNATLVVSGKGESTDSVYANLTVASEMAGVFQDVFNGNVMKKVVVESLTEDVGNFSISANVVPETNLLNVYVTAGTPKASYIVMKAVLERYPEVSEYIFSNAVLEILLSPQVPLAPSNSIDVGNYEKLGVLAALTASAGAICMLSVLRGTVKTEREARRKLDGTFLALIGHEEKNRTLKAKLQRKNKAILIWNPLVSFGYVEMFRKLAFRIQYEMKKQDKQVLLVSSVGENEGKSTIAANIAIALVQSGKKVALVDLDLRRPAIHKIFDRHEEKKKKGFWREKLQMPGNMEMSLIMNNRAVQNPVDYIQNMDLSKLLTQLRKEADYIILDSSPMHVAADAELLCSHVDAGILVVRQDWEDVKEINHYMKVLQKTDISFLGYVLNDFENTTLFGSKQYNYGYGKKYGRYEEYDGESR